MTIFSLPIVEQLFHLWLIFFLLNYQFPEDDSRCSSDNQDWSFKRTPFGWQFRRHSTTPLSEASSSGWLSKPRQAVDNDTVNQSSSSGEGNACKGKETETSNKENDRKQKSSNVEESSVSIDDEFDYLFQEEPVDFRKALKGEVSSQEKDSSQEAENTSAPLSSRSQDKVLKNTPSFLSQFSYKSKEADDGKAPLSAKPSDNTQEQVANFTDLYSYKRKAKGVQFTESESETENNSSASTPVQGSSLADRFSFHAQEKANEQMIKSDSKTDKKASLHQYEQILARKRDSKGGGWIDTHKMKKKLKTCKF